jgi:hypothetical protein
MPMKPFSLSRVAIAVCVTLPAVLALSSLASGLQVPFGEGFRWKTGPALISALSRPGDDIHSIKDPTVVQFGGKWHLFCTIRGTQRSHRIEYVSFADWNRTDRAERHILTVTNGYFCAPQVFHFAPQKLWYMIYQASDPSRKPELQPVYSTSKDISDPGSWTPPRLLFDKQPDVAAWIDFWVICDDSRAHLFYTSLNGRMWRAETRLSEFPRGFGQPVLALQADIFEASHTYRLKGSGSYLTLVEAQASGRRYFKAYSSDRLDGVWTPVADTLEKPFAGVANVQFTGEAWTTSFSHGELLRDGCDQTLTVDPARLRFLFQGVSDKEREGRSYGEIPWRLGLLERR